MKRHLALIFLLTNFIQLFAQSQGELNENARNELKSEFDKLMQVTNQILHDYQNDTVFMENFNAANKVWLEFIDAELKMKFPEREIGWYGSIFPMCYSGYKEFLYKERRLHLSQWLKPLPEGEGCGGSIKRRTDDEDYISLETIEQYDIVRLLNKLEIITDTNSKTLNLRILKVGNFPGSAKMESGEITHDIYFAISEFDDWPNQNLYKVSEFYDPKVDSIDLSKPELITVSISYGSLLERQIATFQIGIKEIKKIYR